MGKPLNFNVGGLNSLFSDIPQIKELKRYDVDNGFIDILEGFRSFGYIPKDNKETLGKSGVTIGKGLDLGQQTEEGLRSLGVDEDLLIKFKPYLGKKKKEAEKFLKDNPLKLEKNELIKLKDFTAKVRDKNLTNYIDYYESTTGELFKDLDKNFQTSIASVISQYGADLPNRTPNFNNAIINNDVEAAKKELRNFKDKYPTRRNKEADLLGFLKGSEASEFKPLDFNIGVDIEEQQKPLDFNVGYGKRADGTEKGKGFFGELEAAGGMVSTEISIGVNIDGREVEIPTLVPTLTEDEKNSLLSGEKPSRVIIGKAISHAIKRMKGGKSPFAEEGEQKNEVLVWTTPEEKNFVEVVKDKVKNVFRASEEERIAEAQNIYAISQQTGIPLGEVAKNIEQLSRNSKITGIKGGLTKDEYKALVFSPLIMAGVATNPIKTAIGLGVFTALDKIVQLEDFLPSDASDAVKSTVELVDFIGKAAIAGGITKNRTAIVEKFTKTKITTTKAAKHIKIPARELYKSLQGEGKGEHVEFLKTLEQITGDRRAIGKAMKDGVDVVIPAETLVQMVDKPWWGKFKKVVAKLPVGLSIEEVQGKFPYKPITQKGIKPIQAEPKVDIPSLPIPIFKGTEEAISFGEKASPEQIEALKIKREETLKKSQELRKADMTDEEMQQAMDLAVEGQFYREALESAEKKPTEIEQPLSEEAKKYKTAGEFVVAKSTIHRPPEADYGASLDDVTEMFGDDMYTPNALRYFGQGFSSDKEGVEIIQSLKGKPEAEVTVYRAVLPIDPQEIIAGDWVSITKEYAEGHGESVLENMNKGKPVILSKKVKAKDLFTDANSLQEWGYRPEGHKDPTKQQLTDIWEKAQGKKLYTENPLVKSELTSEMKQELSQKSNDELKQILNEPVSKAIKDEAKRLLASPPKEPPKKPPSAEGFEEEGWDEEFKDLGKKSNIESIEDVEGLQEGLAEADLFLSDAKKSILSQVVGNVKSTGGAEEKLLPKKVFGEDGVSLDRIAGREDVSNNLQILGYKPSDQGLREFISDFIGEEKVGGGIAKKNIIKPGAEFAGILKKNKQTLKSVIRLGRKLSVPITPGKVKPIIHEKVGVTKDVKEISIKEDVALRTQLRKEVKGAKAGYVEGKRVQKRKDKIKELAKQLNRLIKNQEKVDLALEIEELSGGHYESESSALNEHLTYFQSLQLPEGSKVKGIRKAMAVIARLKASGKIAPKYANRQIRKLRKDLMYQAHKEGVAIRVTKEGKIMLSVRESGVFVSDKFANYKKFKDVDLIAGGQTDTTRMIQEIDGALSVKEKVGTEGQAGQLEQNVLWKTRDMMIQKLNFLEEQKAIAGKIMSGIRKNSKKDRQVTDVLREIKSEDLDLTAGELLQRENIRSITDKLDIIERALAMRRFYNSIIEYQNVGRDMRNQDVIKFLEAYSPEILRDASIWGMFGDVGKTAKEALGGKDLPDYVHPNAPFNPRARAREVGIKYEDRVHSAIDLAERYIITAAKDIFNTSIIQNNKAYIQQLETMGLSKSAQSIASWTSEAYAGMTPKIDKVTNIPPKFEFSKPLTTLINKRGMRYFNHLRNLAVFPLNFAWNLTTQPSSIVLTIKNYGYINTLRGLERWLHPKIRKETARDYYSYIIKAYKSGKLTRQDATGLLGGDVKLYKSVSEILEDYANILGDNMEKLLTGVSIQAAKIQGKSEGLEGEALRQYASDGGGKTQSMYNLEDKPGILRNLVVQTATPYQTFAYEVKNTIQEWAGKTGTPPDDQKERIFQLFRFISATIISAYLTAKAGKKVWDVASRPPLPFSEIWLTPIIKKARGEYSPVKNSVPAPVQTGMAFVEGIDNVLERGDWRKLRNQLTRWLPSILKIPGGVQISRIIDGAIAYAEGGIYDKSGKLMFKIDNDADFFQALFAGVWSTKGGQEYLDKRKKHDKTDLSTMMENVLGKNQEERKGSAQIRSLEKRLVKYKEQGKDKKVIDKLQDRINRLKKRL